MAVQTALTGFPNAGKYPAPPFTNDIGQTSGGQNEADAKEIARLRSTNEVYEAYKDEWALHLAAYEGGPDFAKGENVFKHSREHEEDYKDRVKRVHYLNYCEPLVDFFTSFIFADTIQRNGESNTAFYDQFITDVNLKGEDVTEFMEQVSDDKQIFGLVYVLVDSPRTDPNRRPLTKADEKRLGIRPYWVLIKPTELLDWIVDPFDKLQYAKRQQFVELFDGRTRTCLERYTEWTPTGITITDIDITDPGHILLKAPVTLPNALGEVPLVPFRYKKSKKYPYMGNSFLKDMSYNNREIMNLTSLLQEFLYRQCFNILAVQVDSQVPVQEQTEGEIGTANQLEYPKGAEAPSYIAPSSDPAKFLQDERQRIVNEMYKRAAQDTVNELFNGTKSSGFSKAQSFTTTVPRIASRAEILEKGEAKLMDLTMKYLGKKWDGKIKYKDRYELTNVTDAITQLTSIFRDLMMPSETFAKQELKRIVHEFDGKIPKEDMAKIEAEIDQLDFKEFMDTQKLALIGNAGSSPAEQQKPKQKNTTTEQAAVARTPNAAATKKLKS